MTGVSAHLAERLGMLVREGRQMVAVGELAKDRLQSLRVFVARQSGADATVADWDLILTAFDLLIDMSEAVEATGDLYWGEYEAIAKEVAEPRDTCAA